MRSEESFQDENSASFSELDFSRNNKIFLKSKVLTEKKRLFSLFLSKLECAYCISKLSEFMNISKAQWRSKSFSRFTFFRPGLFDRILRFDIHRNDKQHGSSHPSQTEEALLAGQLLPDPPKHVPSVHHLHSPERNDNSGTGGRSHSCGHRRLRPNCRRDERLLAKMDRLLSTAGHFSSTPEEETQNKERELPAEKASARLLPGKSDPSLVRFWLSSNKQIRRLPMRA